MVMCFVPGCKHHSGDDRCRFYRFPAKEKEKKRWIDLISRADRPPSKSSLVCSCHFVGGLKDNGPTIFMLFSDPPEPCTRRDYAPGIMHTVSPEELRDSTTLSVHRDVGSPPASPKSLSSISEILETQLYYFEDDVVQRSEDGQSLQGAPIRRFDITQPAKRSSLSIVEHKGVKYVVDRSDAIQKEFLVPKSEARNVDAPKDGRTKSNLDSGHRKGGLTLSGIRKTVPPLVKVELHSEEGDAGIQTQSVPKVAPVLNAMLEAQLYFLEDEVKKLKSENEYLKSRFCYANIAESDELVISYTGLPGAEVFGLLLSFCTSFDFCYFYDWKVEKIKAEDQLLMTLMKLRRNESNADLGVRFGCSLGMVTNVVLTWIHLLHQILFLGLMGDVPSTLKNRACLPSCFSDFSGCRMALEMAEVRCTDSKQRFKNNHLTHSRFKRGCVVKGLVGVAPSGVVTFCSKLYPASATDESVLMDCGLLDLLREGDLLLCQKDFSIAAHLLPKGVLLNAPPSVAMPDLTPTQILQARSIARTRIHAERAVCRMKGFSVLDLIPQMLRPYASVVWQVCAALSNMQHPFVKEIEAFY